MKKILIYAALFIIAGIGFTACDKENAPLFAPEQLNKEFGGPETQLTFTYGGEPLIGKTVKFHTSDSRTASITLTDVIPGETQTVLENIELIETDTQYSFNGNVAASAGGIAIAYTGSVNNN